MNKYILSGFVTAGIILASVVGIVANGGTKSLMSSALPKKQATVRHRIIATTPTPPIAQNDVKTSLTALWQDTGANANHDIQLAVYDHNTSQTYIFVNGGSQIYTASIIKVFILADKMSYGALNDSQKQEAENMIKNSDNDSATSLSDSFGGIYAYGDFFNKLGMSHSQANQTWGMTETTAEDQLKLLNDIFYNHTVVSPSDSAYIQSLMSNIEDGQNWGVGTNSGSANIALKNGWLPLSNNYGNAIVNSIGHVQNDKVDYTIAILSDGNVTQDVGINDVSDLASKVFDVMNR